MLTLKKLKTRAQNNEERFTIELSYSKNSFIAKTIIHNTVLCKPIYMENNDLCKYFLDFLLDTCCFPVSDSGSEK